MSMKREEAIKILECMAVDLTGTLANTKEPMLDVLHQRLDAINVAQAALRPVSREQVEKVWPGCEFCNRADFGEFGFEITKHYAKISCALGSWRFPKGEQFLFCPKCGKPLTDEAVEMVMERLEELKDAGD